MSDVRKALTTVPKPWGLMRLLARVFVQYRVVQRAPDEHAVGYRESAAQSEGGTLASPDVIRQASELGLRFAGVYAFLGLFGWVPREGWVSEDGAVRVSARRAKAWGLEGMMSAYYLSTTFDDGSVLLTWAKSPAPLASTERVESRGGTGDLATDLATHRASIEGRASLRPIPVATLDDCVELSRYHDRHLTTDDQLSGIIVPRVIGWGGLVALVVAAVWWLVRLVR